MRTSRDATLSAPTLLLPSIQVNIRAGAFPPAEDNGVRYLRIPVTFKADHMANALPACCPDRAPYPFEDRVEITTMLQVREKEIWP
jgi:hypothetical protein